MKKAAYLKPLVHFFIIGLLITTLSRLFLFFVFRGRVEQTPDFWMIFPIGLRMDLIVLCYLSFLPAVLLSFLPEKSAAYDQEVFQFLFYAFSFLDSFYGNGDAGFYQ